MSMTTIVAVAIGLLPLGLLVRALTAGARLRLRAEVVYSCVGWVIAASGAASLLSTDPSRTWPPGPILQAMWIWILLWVAYFWTVAIRAAWSVCSWPGFAAWVVLLLGAHLLLLAGVAGDLVPWLPVIVFTIVMFRRLGAAAKREVAGPALG